MNKKAISVILLILTCLLTSSCNSSSKEAVLSEPAVYQELVDPDVFNLLWDMSPQEVLLQEAQNNIMEANGIYSAEKVEFAEKEWKATYEFDNEDKLNNVKCEYIGDNSQKAFEEMTEYFLRRYGLGLITDTQAAWRGQKYDIFMERTSETMILNLGRKGMYYSYFSKYEGIGKYPAEYKDAFYCYKNAVGVMTLDEALDVALYTGIPATLTPPKDENGKNLITMTNGEEYTVNIYTAPKDGVQTVSLVQLKHEVSIWDYSLEINNASHQGTLTYSVVDYKHGSKKEIFDTFDEAADYFFDFQNNYRKNNILGGISEENSSTPTLTVPHGEVLDVNVTGDILIVKTKITPSFNNHSTISQNFFNLEDLIKNQGCSKYDEIQYWAVADMTDGSESKVISFTAPKSTIDGIKDGSIEVIAYLDEYEYVTDVYILPSLLQD